MAFTTGGLKRYKWGPEDILEDPNGVKEDPESVTRGPEAVNGMSRSRNPGTTTEPLKYFTSAHFPHSILSLTYNHFTLSSSAVFLVLSSASSESSDSESLTSN